MQRSLALFAAVSFCALFTGPALADLDDEIGEASDAGIEFLLKAIEVKQVETGEHDGYNNGKIALETYALVVAGVSVEHPVIQKNLNTLSKIPLGQTYVAAVYAFLLDAVISQLQGDAALASPSQRLRDDAGIGSQYRQRLEEAVTSIVKIRQGKGGRWFYTAGGNDFDNSNTQFAVLGLGVGAKRGVAIPREVWEEVATHYLKCQKKEGPEVQERCEFHPEEDQGEGKRDRVNIVDKDTKEKVSKDKPKKGAEPEKKKEQSTTAAKVPEKEKKSESGPEHDPWFARGWAYKHDDVTWNMTCGGTSSMILVLQTLGEKAPTDLTRQVKKSIQDGYAWLIRNWNITAGGGFLYYGIYSLEKVADLGEVKKFGTHDWFVEVARHTVADQRDDGSWPGPNRVQVRWNTALALLVLNRATTLLTQGRSVKGKIMMTGGVVRDRELSDDRNWVYLAEYDREFHLPSVLRQLRLRPSQKLLKILESALKQYPEQERGFLVMNLLHQREAQKQKGVRAFLDDQIESITGVKYKESALYETWYRRWVDIRKIGTDATDPEGWLPKFYESTKQSVPLKLKLLWAVGRVRNPEIAPLVIDDLAHPSVEVRHAAYETLSLMRLSKETIPLYDAKTDESVRGPQAAVIRDWFNRSRTENAVKKG